MQIDGHVNDEHCQRNKSKQHIYINRSLRLAERPNICDKGNEICWGMAAEMCGIR